MAPQAQRDCLSVRPSVCMPARLSVRISVCIYVYLSVCLCLVDSPFRHLIRVVFAVSGVGKLVWVLVILRVRYLSPGVASLSAVVALVNPVIKGIFCIWIIYSSIGWFSSRT